MADQPARRPGPLRVLYLHQHFSRPEGSTGTRSFHNAAALARAGHHVTLACGRYEGAVTGLRAPFRRGRRTGAMEGFELVEFDIPMGNAQSLKRRALACLRYAAAATRLALGRDWDVILASSTPLTVAIPALAARRWRGTPFVFEMRDPWPELPRALSAAMGGAVPGPVLAALDRLADAACGRAAFVVALTEGMAELAVARGTPRPHVVVLEQGADLDLFGPHVAPWRPPGVPPEELLAVYAGAHGRANGLDQLLDAAALLGEGEVRILLVGDGSEKGRLLVRAARERLPVTFLDPLPKPELAALLAGADVALLCLAPVPDFAEWTAPNKLAEALAAGRAVVANVPGRAARLLEGAGAGIAVPAGDPAALAAALRRLAADPTLRAEMGGAARRVAELRLDARAIGDRLAGVVEAAAARR
jgi:glycosyltransferase involved in cell wall biosynthesis